MLFWGGVFNWPVGFHFLEVKKCNSPECTMLRDASQVEESRRQIEDHQGMDTGVERPPRLPPVFPMPCGTEVNHPLSLS